MTISDLGEVQSAPPPHRAPRLIVVMGVSAAGKSSVSAALAEQLALPWLDADDLHPAANTEKMSAGQALTDEDRWPWLKEVARHLAAASGTGGVVIACSALRRAYRDHIRRDAPGAVFIHLTGPRALLIDRAACRVGHFMPATLLESQLNLLESLESDEAGTTLQVDASVLDLATGAASWVDSNV